MLPVFPTPPGVDRNPGNAILTSPDALERELLAPFHPDDVDWKPGPAGDSNRALVFPYVDAAAIRSRLTKVCGIGGWQALPYQIAPGQLGVALAVWINGQWIVKADGAWSGDLDLDHVDPTDKKAAAKKADAISKDAKGAISNALKRAAGAWGMGEYLRQLGRIYEEVESRGYSKVLTDAAKKRLYGLAADPYFAHHGRIAAGHEAAARKALAAGDLGSAYGASKEAFKIRHEVFGKDHETTVRARAVFEDVKGRQAVANGSAPVAATLPASTAAPTAAATAAPASQPVAAPETPATASGTDLRTILDRLTTAGSVEEVRAAYAPAWKALGNIDTPDGLAFRNAIEAAMQRFQPGWTLAAAEAAAREAKGRATGTAPASQNGASAASAQGGAPAAARAPEGTGKAPRKPGTGNRTAAAR